MGILITKLSIYKKLTSDRLIDDGCKFKPYLEIKQHQS